MKRVCIPCSLCVNREPTVLCQHAEFQKQGVKINTENKQRKRESLPGSLSVNQEVTMNLH